MINWIINKFGDKTDDSSELSAKGRTRIGQAASVMCIICNVVLCAAKGGIGLAVGSISIVADALNNLSDASSNVISLLGFRFASKPADEHHPLGHGRYEYLASLAVAVLICILGTQLARESVEKIFSPEPAEFSTAAVVVLVLSMLVKLWMSYFNGKLGKMIDSDTLRATAVDSRNDVITTALILASSVFMQLTGINIDGWVGLGMGAFITIGGIQLLRETVSPLLGSAPDKAFVDKAFSMIIAYPGILDTYDLMAHDYGPGACLCLPVCRWTAAPTASPRMRSSTRSSATLRRNLAPTLSCTSIPLTPATTTRRAGSTTRPTLWTRPSTCTTCASMTTRWRLTS